MTKKQLKYDFDMLCIEKSTTLIDKRKESNLTQNDMAYMAGVSLKSIQRFEALKYNNPYLIYAYQQILK
jgi:DNA-binding XRE family transcriptional regulator